MVPALLALNEDIQGEVHADAPLVAEVGCFVGRQRHFTVQYEGYKGGGRNQNVEKWGSAKLCGNVDQSFHRILQRGVQNT